MATKAKTPHKAKPSHTGRKHERNYLGRDKRKSGGITKYVARMKRRGTFRERKGIQRKSH